MQAFEKFLAPFPTRTYQKGEVILQHEEVPKHGYAIRSGVVMTYSIDAPGIKHPVVFDVAGEVFPIGWVLGHISQTAYFYEAFNTCTVTCFSQAEFKRAIQEDSQLAAELYSSLGRRFLGLQQRIEALGQSRASRKVLLTLRYLCTRFGQPIVDGSVYMDLPLTQQDIANFIGLTRETTAIELKRLEKNKVISYDRRHFVVRMQKLNDLIAET